MRKKLRGPCLIASLLVAGPGFFIYYHPAPFTTLSLVVLALAPRELSLPAPGLRLAIRSIAVEFSFAASGVLLPIPM